jgi:hypothetical protein
VRGFFLQADIHRSVADQVAMPSGAAKCLKEHVLLSLPCRGRRLGPQTSQRISCALQLACGEMNGKERQDEVKAVMVAPQQDEVIAVAQRREFGLARYGHRNLLSGCQAVRRARITGTLLQLNCNKN